MVIFFMLYGIRILLLIMMLVAVAEADIYKYEDDSGVTYYTDFPLNKKAERIMRTSESRKEDIKRDTNSGIDEIVNEKAKRYDLHPSLVHAVIKAESNGNPYAVSRKGAMGLMQLMPSTANDLRVRNPFDPEENIDGGVRYLRYLIDRFNGDLTLALAAYNAGPKTVEKTKDVPRIPETKEYVKKVMSLYKGDNPGARVSSKNPPEASPKPAPIYKIVQEDGTILFTNSPVYKKNPRL
jgi:hypothetical protein